MNRSKLYAFVVGIAIAVCAAVAAPASATHNAAKPIHPGVMTFTQGAQCTSNFIFRDGARHLHRPGGALLGHRRRHGDERLRQRLASDRHPGGGRRRHAAGNPGLQLVAGDAGGGRDQRRRLPVQRLRAGARSTPRMSARRPVGSRVRRPDRGRSVVGDARRHRLLVRQLLAARRDHQAEPEAGHRRPGRGQRLEPHRLHGRRPGSPATPAAGSWAAPARRSAS